MASRPVKVMIIENVKLTDFSLSSYKNRLNWQLSSGYSKITNREDLFITRRVNDVPKQASIFYPVNIDLTDQRLLYQRKKQYRYRRFLNTYSDRTTSNFIIIENNYLNELIRKHFLIENAVSLMKLNSLVGSLMTKKIKLY